MPNPPAACRQQQPGAGDGMLIVEGDIDLVQHHVRGWHKKVPS
jgi:hypothetical protein